MITVQSFSSTRDATGQPVPTWTNRFINLPASFHDVRGGGTYRGEQLQETVDAVFETRYQAGFSPNQRVLFGGETYNITRVSKADGLNRYLAIYATAVKA
jgi:SPP1 family predicted phage head-tail adaptor